MSWAPRCFGACWWQRRSAYFLFPATSRLSKGCDEKRNPCRSRFRLHHRPREHIEMKRTAFVAIVGFLLTGCTLGPDYLRPTMLIPDNYRGVVGAPVAESLADLPWWEVFRDPV